ASGRLELRAEADHVVLPRLVARDRVAADAGALRLDQGAGAINQQSAVAPVGVGRVRSTESSLLPGADQARDRIVAVSEDEVARRQVPGLLARAISLDRRHIRIRTAQDSTVLLVMATIQSHTHEVRRAAANPGLKLLQRLGYVVRGVLYVTMGVLALRIALGKPDGRATDLNGSLLFVIGNPLGKWLLLGAIIGLAAYSLWGLIRAAFDPLHRGSDPSGYMERLGFVSSAVSYAAIAIFGLQILVGAKVGGGDPTQTTIASVLTHPAGGALTLGIGLAAIGIGIGQFIEAYRAVFKRDLKGAEMTESERKIVVALGRFGMFARGVTFTIIGWFLVQAGMQHDVSKAQGFGGASLFILSQPYGPALLAIVALGF